MSTVLKAETAVYGGYVLAREEGVIFIRGAIPGELVEVRLLEKKRDYSIAEVSGIVEPSGFRVDAPCRYFGDCGGCQLQYIAYDRQVTMKNEILLDCLRRIGGIDIALEPAVAGEPFAYRRRGQFKVVGKGGAIGFFRAGTREVVDIDSCPLMVPELNEAYSKVRGADLSGIKEIHITRGDSSTLMLIKGRGYDDSLAEEFGRMGFDGVVFEDRSYRNKGHVELDLEGLVYTVSPWSFFQSNWALNKKVAGLVAEGLALGEGARVLDMYAGAGNFSLHIAAGGQEVVGIEENADAIRDGERNALLNKIENFKFIEGRAETAKIKGTFDAVILNPPRLGLAKEALQRVLDIAPSKIAYISCNPSTFARDLKRLEDAYDIQSMRAIDFFPNTYHIESLAFLLKK